MQTKRRSGFPDRRFQSVKEPLISIDEISGSGIQGWKMGRKHLGMQKNEAEWSFPKM